MLSYLRRNSKESPRGQLGRIFVQQVSGENSTYKRDGQLRVLLCVRGVLMKLSHVWLEESAVISTYKRDGQVDTETCNLMEINIANWILKMMDNYVNNCPMI